MKKKVALILLTLVLVLTLMAPATALAAKPAAFEATGYISGITEGTVLPAGESGRFRVVERELSGTLSGDIGGAFIMAYKANVELATQAGTLHGTLNAGDYDLKVNGKIQPLEFVGWYVPGVVPIYKLTINGNWTFVDGAQGTGDFEAWVNFVPTPDGHVYFITDSSIALTGNWHQ